jgi:aspartate/methionine/tyrosine aminotransferase
MSFVLPHFFFEGRKEAGKPDRLYTAGLARTMGALLVPPVPHLLCSRDGEDATVAIPLFVTRLLVRSGVARWLPSVRRAVAGGEGFLPYYSDRVLAAPHAELGRLSGWQEVPGPDIIDLGSGATRFDLVPSASTKLPLDRRGWPPAGGLAELRQAIAAKLADQAPAHSPGEEVLVTHGAAGAFAAVLDAFVNPGDRVVLFDPTSPLFILGCQSRRARIRWVPCWLEGGCIRFRLAVLAKAMRGAKLVVLAAPANPMGGVIAPEDMEQIAWWAKRRDVLVVSDDSFERYWYEGDRVRIGALPHGRRRTLTLGSMSKGYALASLRVGWVSGHHHLVRACHVMSILTAPFVPMLAQQVALTALRQPKEAFQSVRKEFDARRRYGYERLLAMGLQPSWPSGAFFFWVPVREFGLTGRLFAERLLASKRALVWPGELFGPSGGDFVRLSYATEDGRFREGLTRLVEFMRELRASVGEQRRAA